MYLPLALNLRQNAPLRALSLYVSVLTSLFVSFATTSFAGDESTIALSQSSYDGFSTSDFIGITMISLVVLGLIIITWVSSSRFRIRAGQQVQNLFLGVKVNRMPKTQGPAGEREVAYLRELGVGNAMLVARSAYAKGDHVLVHLDTLPNFPRPKAEVEGIVKAVEKISENPDSFIVHIDFPDASSKATYGISDYLRYLTSRRSSPIQG
jgi:hypothetical protein